MKRKAARFIADRRFNQNSYISDLYVSDVYIEKVSVESLLDNVRCLHSALTLGQIIRNTLAFVQCLESFALNSGEVNKYILSVFTCDESIAFFCVEPLNCTLHYGTSIYKKNID